MLVEMALSFLRILIHISAVVQASREHFFLVAGKIPFSDTETSFFICARFGVSG